MTVKNNIEKKEKIEVDCNVINTLPNTIFLLGLPDILGGGQITGYLSGKMRVNNIKIIIGDTVTVELSPYDLNKGRIIFRKSS